MASIPTHALTALSLAPWFAAPGVPKRIWGIGMVLAALPDIDVLAFRFGVPYGAPLGHRGLSHSLLSAIVVACVVARIAAPGGLTRPRLGLYLALAMGSHGVLDACTNGGHGVALLAPLDWTRYFAPFQPIEVSPIGLRRFLSGRGLAVLVSEAIWVWLPASALALAGFRLNRARSLRAAA